MAAPEPRVEPSPSVSKPDLLPPPVLELLDRAAATDVVVGVTTFNDASTIEGVTRALADGLRQGGRGASAVLVNCDAGSQDGTPGLLARASEGGPPTWLVQHPIVPAYLGAVSDAGVPGRTHAIRLLFAIAERLQAKACVYVDGNLTSLTSEWVERLIEPVLENSRDCVLPLYRRNPYEGTLTNTILYPLTRALYGKRVRFHLGGAGAVSGKFASSCLAQPSAWDGDIPRFGLDGWLATVAVAEDVNVCQSFLGSRMHEFKPGGADLSATLAQSVGGVFQLMERYAAVWETVRGSVPVASYGPSYESGKEPGAPKVERMVQAFQQGLRDLLHVWEIILEADTLQQILPLGLSEASEFRFPTDLWVQTVYDFAVAYHDRVVHREHLLKALAPLYLGYTASLVLATREDGPERMEQVIERLCQRYESMKPYLTQRWRFQ